MPFWKTKRTDKQTDALVQRMVQEWKVSPDDAREPTSRTAGTTCA